MFQKLFRSEKAVSSVVGVVLIIGLTITSIGIILIYSVPAIDGIENTVKVKNMEQSFSALDARMSEVTLGETQSQVVDIPLMQGSLNINDPQKSDTESKLATVIISTDANFYHDYMESGLVWGAWDEYDENEIDFFISEMGSIEYTRSGHKVAYEGGGVWSQYPNGRSIMVSPPEFHYNGETLTLPIMNIRGSGSISGNGDVSLSLNSDNAPVQLFPNNYSSNPLDADKILIYIKSEYYDGWASYANSQTYSSAVMDHGNKTTVIELDVIPPMGRNSLSNFFKVGVIDQDNKYSMHDFLFDITVDTPGNSHGFNKFDTTLEASSGSKTLKFHFESTGKPDGVRLESLKYTDTSREENNVEEWKGIHSFEVYDNTSTLDLLDNDLIMEPLVSPGFSWESTNNFNSTNFSKEQSLHNLTQHYIKLITQDGAVVFELKDDANQSSINMDKSTYYISYDARPGSMIYLHVTENEVNVELT